MDLLELNNYLETKIPLLDSPIVIENQVQQKTKATLFYSYESVFEPAASDLLGFGRFWSHIRPKVLDGTLSEFIHQRQLEIDRQKEYWKARLVTLVDQDFNEEIAKTSRLGKLVRIFRGAGAAYFMLGDQDEPLFIVKPVDEDILCLNNSKFYATPFNDPNYRVRDHIPLYRSAQTDVVAYMTSFLLDLNITPKVAMAILTNTAFHDLEGHSQKEKLCSVQEYVKDASCFHEEVQKWLTLEKSEDEIQQTIDQEDFEDANLFIWLTYDNDAHAGNFLCYVKKEDIQGHPIFGLKKIDNGLSFPEKNSNLQNVLPLFPNAQEKLSSRLKEKIAAISLEDMSFLLNQYEMDRCIDSLKDRIEVLQYLAKREDLTILDINFRMKLLEEEDGKELALSPLSQEALEEYFFLLSSSSYE